MILATYVLEGYAQLVIGTDAAYSTRYVWRGVTRTSDPVLQPDVYLAFAHDDAFLTAGVWASFEPFRAGETDLSDSGVGEKGVGELNYWVEYARRLRPVEFALGWTRYMYEGDAERGGRGSEFNTSEIYSRVQLVRLPLKPKLAVWYDVERVKGAYIETSLDLRVPLLPLRLGPLRSIHLSGLAGWSAGQESNEEEPSGGANFADPGLTHLDLSLWASFVLVDGLSMAPAFHFQVSQDESTRRTSLDPADADRSTKVWFTLSVSWSHAIAQREDSR